MPQRLHCYSTHERSAIFTIVNDRASLFSFPDEVGAGIADGRIRYREDLHKAPEAFIGMLEGRNFGKLIVRVRV